MIQLDIKKESPKGWLLLLIAKTLKKWPNGLC